MAPGADKIITYDPPGAIGIVDDAAVIMLRFDEIFDGTPAVDEAGALSDMSANPGATGLSMPPVALAAVGRGRLFDDGRGLVAGDRVPGSTLLTRDVSIQVILSWLPDSQAILGEPGMVIARGVYNGDPGTGICYGLQIAVVDAPSSTAQIQWLWSDLAGVTHVQTGAQFTLPADRFTMLTATRRWVSPTSVVLRYYIGDLLLGEAVTGDGDIAGATTDLVLVGTLFVFDDPVLGDAFRRFFAGTIDEIMVTGRELCHEEVEATWLRITTYQPLGTQMFREMFDADFPVFPIEPDSDAALDIRRTGQALGYAAAQIENLRANFLPQRAYGATLEQWEEAVRVTPKPVQGLEARRARVLARLRQRRGISIPGLGDALVDLIDADLSDLEFIAYSNTIEDGFITVDPVLWDMTPTGCAVLNSGRARIAPGAGDFRELRLLGGSLGWRTMARPVSQAVATVAGFGGEHVLAKLVFTTPQANAEAGVWFGDKSIGNYILLGLRDVAGVFSVVAQSYLAGVAQGLVTVATLGANPAAVWLHLYEDVSVGGWIPAWSTTSGATGFTLGSHIPHPTLVHWAGCYVRSTAALGSGPVADFDDFVLWTPNGTRPFNAYIFRDPALGGSPDLEAIHSVLQAIKHAFTHVAFITSRALLSGDPGSGVNRGPMGAL